MSQPMNQPIPPVAPGILAETVEEATGRDPRAGVLDADAPVAPDEPREDEPTIIRSPDLERGEGDLV